MQVKAWAVPDGLLLRQKDVNRKGTRGTVDISRFIIGLNWVNTELFRGLLN